MNTPDTPKKATDSSDALFELILSLVSLVGLFVISVYLGVIPDYLGFFTDLTPEWASVEKSLKKRERYIESDYSGRGVTPFLEAAAQGDIKAMQMLISYGANTQARAKNGMTALHFAAAAPQGRGIVWLLKKADLNIESRDNHGLTPFLVAAIMEKVKAMQILAQEGADIHATLDDGRTALHCAVAQSEGRGIVWLLKEVHFNIESRDQEGITPFLLAVLAGKVKAMQTLKENGADLQAKDYDGRDATYYIQKIKDPQKKKEVEDWLRDNLPPIP